MAPGERKAVRKMIVLSNTNALSIPDLQDMTAENISDPAYRATVLAIPDKIVSQLRAAETFQTKQRWKLFRKPSVVMRSVDIRLAQMMDDARESKRVIKQVISGERGAGKSLYLLQAAASAMLKEWIVIIIPEGLYTPPNSHTILTVCIAQDLTSASTEYGPLPNVRPTVYSQRVYTAALLQRTINANPQLATMKTILDHQISITIPADITLANLATIGIADTQLAHPIFEAFMKELIAPGRPPLLITLDGFNHINKLSAYRSASYQLIHAHDIHLPAWFISHISGASPLPNGGAVLAAMTRSNGPTVRTLDDRIEHLERQQSILSGSLTIKPEDNITLPFLKATGQEHLATQLPDLDPFVRYDTRVLNIFNHNAPNPLALSPPSSPSSSKSPPQTTTPALTTQPPAPTSSSSSSWLPVTPPDCEIEIKRLTGLTKLEAKSLMEYWALSGILRAEISERFVGEQWSVAGGGLPGELERTCLGMRFCNV